MSAEHRGSCLCGRVHFVVRGEIPAPDACHCQACRKSSGHYFVSADIQRAAIDISGLDEVRWYHSTPDVRRGFCGHCGATLFWDRPGRDWIGVAMGAFDTPTGSHIHVHIFVAEKGDYYEIGDGVPQYARVPER
ncbi:MAG: GFA family protein [Xanthomonadales bacterium]|nr:hypothetical protein [Xanthomonadales bacterium]MCC6592799.1 GFA family protein [Xanthomonadales bacterium]MCE7931698.1 GFA family protein [Xanthomonadales bacterium PRO6]